MSSYYLCPNGVQQGPYSVEQLQTMLRDGTLQSNDYCWIEGFDAWKPLADVLPIQISAAAPDDHSNVSRQPVESVTVTYGGIKRAPYCWWFLLIVVMFPILHVVAAGVPRILGNDSALGGLILILCFFTYTFLPIAPIIPSYFRLKNIGMNPWLCLLGLIPIVNLFIYVRCFICKEGSATIKGR